MLARGETEVSKQSRTQREAGWLIASKRVQIIAHQHRNERGTILAYFASFPTLRSLLPLLNKLVSHPCLSGHCAIAPRIVLLVVFSTVLARLADYSELLTGCSERRTTSLRVDRASGTWLAADQEMFASCEASYAQSSSFVS